MAWNREKNIKYRFKVGDKVGYWTVLIPEVFDSKGLRKARCRCICGKERDVIIFDLATGGSLSCGCKRMEKENEKQKEGRKIGAALMGEIHASNAMAGLNHALNKNSSTGHTGVSYMKQYGKYRAYITLHRKQIYLGLYETLEEAVKARKEAEEKYYSPYREIVKEIKEKYKVKK